MEELENKNTVKILKGILILALVSSIVFSILPLKAREEPLSTVPVFTTDEKVKTSEEATSASAKDSLNLPVKTEPRIKINPDLKVQNAVVYSLDGNYILFEKNAEEKIQPSSLSKLLTAVTALRYLSPETVLTVGKELSLVPKGASTCLIKEGHKISLSGLLAGMLLASGNDAAYTIAVNAARLQSKNSAMTDSEALAYFVNLMNAEAIYLGLKNSTFTSPDGWDDEKQYTTVYDLLLLSKCVCEKEELLSLVKLKEKYVLFASGENAVWKNTNALQNPNDSFYLSSSLGLKAGMSKGAGRCVISLLTSGKKKYIVVAMGAKTDEDRYGAVKIAYEEIVKAKKKASSSK